MATTQMNYAGGAVQTTITADINNSTLTIPVASLSGYPASGTPFTITLENGSATKQETIKIASYVGLTLTASDRGWDGTAAQTHTSGASVIHSPDAAGLTDLMARSYVGTTIGDIAYVANTSTKALARLAAGATGTVLSIVAGIPAWVVGLLASNNLSDLASASSARTNLGLGSVATHATTEFPLVANNLSDVTAATARTNLGLGTAATHNASEFLSNFVSPGGNYTALGGDLIAMTGSGTVTLPSNPVQSRTVGVIAVNGTVTVSAGINVINGPGVVLAANITLATPGAFAVFQGDGANWNIVAGAQDTGWVAMSGLTNSWASVGPPWAAAGYRKLGDAVYLRGRISGGASSAAAFTMPASFMPLSQVQFAVGGTGGNIATTVQITAAGVLSGVFAAGGAAVSLDGIRFSLS